MSHESDLTTIAEQERLLRFANWPHEMAWRIGSALRDAAIAKDAATTFEIQIAGRVLFQCITGEPPAAQVDWIRRKRNTVMRFGRSSYALGLELGLSGKTLEARHEGLTLKDYAMHGGGFPILLAGVGCVGSIIASGLPQREDHNLVVDAISGVMGCEVPRLAEEN